MKMKAKDFIQALFVMQNESTIRRHHIKKSDCFIENYDSNTAAQGTGIALSNYQKRMFERL